MRRPLSAAASASIARNSGSRTWKEQLAVSNMPPGARQRIARRLIS